MGIETNVALLGYGTVGAAVDRLLAASADDIERATGHRLRVVKALVRDPSRYPDAAACLLTNDVTAIADDPSIAVVAEVMGGLDPAGPYVLDLLARGKHVVTANKQLVARRAPELFAAASASGVQLRFEASVCAAIPVIKVLREALVVTNVHRVLGIVNGTTNFVLTEMEAGSSYAEALADAQGRVYEEADTSEDVYGYVAEA
jgi:homoserine dehydrogenase